MEAEAAARLAKLEQRAKRNAAFGDDDGESGGESSSEEEIDIAALRKQTLARYQQQEGRTAYASRAGEASGVSQLEARLKGVERSHNPPAGTAGAPRRRRHCRPRKREGGPARCNRGTGRTSSPHPTGRSCRRTRDTRPSRAEHTGTVGGELRAWVRPGRAGGARSGTAAGIPPAAQWGRDLGGHPSWAESMPAICRSGQKSVGDSWSSGCATAGGDASDRD